jgi:hypothetical protein
MFYKMKTCCLQELASIIADLGYVWGTLHRKLQMCLQKLISYKKLAEAKIVTLNLA